MSLSHLNRQTTLITNTHTISCTKYRNLLITHNHISRLRVLFTILKFLRETMSNTNFIIINHRSKEYIKRICWHINILHLLKWLFYFFNSWQICRAMLFQTSLSNIFYINIFNYYTALNFMAVKLRFNYPLFMLSTHAKKNSLLCKLLLPDAIDSISR